MNWILKTLPLAVSIHCGLHCTAQQHCIELADSRRLHQDAYRSYVQDTLISELSGKIVLLEDQTANVRENFTALLESERQKNQLLKDNAISYQQMNASFQSELNYVKKKERKARRQRNAAVGIGVILLVLAVVP